MMPNHNDLPFKKEDRVTDCLPIVLQDVVIFMAWYNENLILVD